jgi:hypothetical protein
MMARNRDFAVFSLHLIIGHPRLHAASALRRPQAFWHPVCISMRRGDACILLISQLSQSVSQSVHNGFDGLCSASCYAGLFVLLLVHLTDDGDVVSSDEVQPEVDALAGLTAGQDALVRALQHHVDRLVKAAQHSLHTHAHTHTERAREQERSAKAERMRRQTK